MRFLADENIPGDAVEALRVAGHDVTWVREIQPGLPDENVVAAAARDGRTLLTFDKDFGELAVLRSTTLPAGVVLFRVRASDSGDAVSLVVNSISGRSDWAGRFSVVEHDRIRSSPLPGTPEDT